MHSFESAQSLVNKILAMVVGKILSSDHAVHVCFHKFLGTCQSSRIIDMHWTHLNEIDLGECLIISWLLNVKDGDDVFVVEVS